MRRSLKRKFVIGGAALAVAAGAGGAYAATQNSGPTTRQAFLDDVAKRLHVTPEQLNQALRGAFDDQLQAAVKAGRLTQAQANALKQRLQQKGTAAPLPFGPRLARPWMHGGRFGLIAGPGELPAAARYLGLTVPQLFQQLASGKSLAQIATAKGKTVSGLEQAMTAAAKSRLDKAVAANLITSAQEQKILARIPARIARQVNEKGLPHWRRIFPPRLRGGALPTPPMRPVPAPGALPIPYGGGPAAPTA